MPDFNRGFDGGVGYYDSAEGAKGGEGVERGGRAQKGVNVLEVLGEKGGEGVEVLRGSELVGRVTGCCGRATGTVMRRVFDGGEGVISGGRAERSRESGVWVLSGIEVDVGLPDGEAGGDVSWADIVGDRCVGRGRRVYNLTGFCMLSAGLFITFIPCCC